MDRFLIILLAILLVSAGLTSALHVVARRRKLIKYIPPLLALMAGISQIYLARTGSGGWDGLIRGIWAVMLLWGSISGFATGLVWDLVIPRLRHWRRPPRPDA